MAQKPNDPRRGFGIGDDIGKGTKPPTGSLDEKAAGLLETLRQITPDVLEVIDRPALRSEAARLGIVPVRSSNPEIRLRCLEVLRYLEFRSMRPAALIAAAAELEDYVLNGQGKTPAPPST